MNNDILLKERKSVLQYGYWMTLFMLTLTGFAQMPIFKRYYIADIPGLGWLAQFYVTHYLHYLFAILLLAFIGYVLTRFLIDRKRQWKISPSGMIRMTILAGLVVTGILLVIKNFSGYRFSPELITVMTVLHLGLVVVLLLYNLYCISRRKKWYQR